MLSQKRKLHLTSGFALFLQIFTIVCGFILPRLYLEYYGSAVNGLVSSITQFLGFIALAECGVGAVVQSALYRPLAQKDLGELSKIVVSAEHFFRNIAKLLLLYTVILALLYPYVVNEKFDFIYTASLILIISISSFAQYYFGITYRLLLFSDQFGFVPIIIQIEALLLNLVASVILMKFGCSVHIVKFASSMVFLLQPLTVSFIAHRWYRIDRTCKYEKNAIPQKWNGLAQHFSAVILQSSGVVVLTFLSTLENVSVYAIYYLVVNGVRSLTTSITSGMQAFLGNLFAKGDLCLFKEKFESFEWKLHFFVTIIFSSTAALIVPFVGVYTRGITDVNYFVPVFGITLTAAWGVYCIRLPYNTVVLAVGHYKQTQSSAIIEVCLNLTTSIIFVLKYGLWGVAMGTLIAMVYRTCYLAWYISKNVISRNLSHFIKHLCVDIIAVALFCGLMYKILGLKYENGITSYLEWSLLALKVFPLSVAATCVANGIFYSKRMLLARKYSFSTKSKRQEKM